MKLLGLAILTIILVGCGKSFDEELVDPSREIVLRCNSVKAEFGLKIVSPILGDFSNNNPTVNANIDSVLTMRGEDGRVIKRIHAARPVAAWKFAGNIEYIEYLALHEIRLPSRKECNLVKINLHTEHGNGSLLDTLKGHKYLFYARPSRRP